MGKDGVRVIMLGDFINDKKRSEEINKYGSTVLHWTVIETIQQHILH